LKNARPNICTPEFSNFRSPQIGADFNRHAKRRTIVELSDYALVELLIES